MDVMIGLIKILKKYLCYNNAEENIFIKKACKKEGLGVDFEYTAPGVPQQNGFIERKFALCSMVVNSMLIFEMVNGPKLQTPPCFLIITFSLRIEA